MPARKGAANAQIHDDAVGVIESAGVALEDKVGPAVSMLLTPEYSVSPRLQYGGTWKPLNVNVLGFPCTFVKYHMPTSSFQGNQCSTEDIV